MSARAIAFSLSIGVAASACKRQQSFEEPEPSWSRMMEQPRVDPYEPSLFFDDGRGMRRPPTGTISSEAIVGDRALTDGVLAGAYVTRAPLPITAALVARGRRRFDVYCAACHGVDGSGESVVARNMELRKPPSLHEPRVRALVPGALYHVVTTGYGLMPSYAAQLSVADRWAVVVYVEALQRSRHAEISRLPADARAALEEATR